MAQLLTTYASLLLRDRDALLNQLTAPLLIWEPLAGDLVPEEGTETGDRIWATEAGRPTRRPKVGDPMVYEVRRSPSSTSPLPTAVTVGRVRSTDIWVSHPSISRIHAWFVPLREGPEWMLTDGQSRNGTWINALRLAPRTPTQLTAGALVRFGDVQMTFHQPATFLRYLEKEMAT